MTQQSSTGTPEMVQTYAGMSPDFPGSGRIFDRGANRRSVHRHLDVWSQSLRGGYTNNAEVFPKEQP